MKVPRTASASAFALGSVAAYSSFIGVPATTASTPPNAESASKKRPRSVFTTVEGDTRGVPV
eukprot:scaffold36132_cov34-Tisochrysis_lutea.AAC.2